MLKLAYQYQVSVWNKVRVCDIYRTLSDFRKKKKSFVTNRTRSNSKSEKFTFLS